MNELLKELQLVSSAAPKGSHKEVAEIFGISNEYLYQIRVGRNMTTDNSENREKIKDIISEYRGIIKRESQRLASI